MASNQGMMMNPPQQSNTSMIPGGAQNVYGGGQQFSQNQAYLINQNVSQANTQISNNVVSHGMSYQQQQLQQMQQQQMQQNHQLQVIFLINFF